MSMQDYELVRVLGQGMYGTAHLAIHKPTKQEVCMKVIATSGKDGAEAALKEARLLAMLDNINVLGYKESFMHKSQLYIVTDYCEEGDLFSQIRHRKEQGLMYSENEVMNAFIQLANGLNHIHSKKILHRDLKTQNVFIARGGVLKLGDLGIARVLEGTHDMASTVTGTPYFMAPEVCTSRPYTFKSDMWSLGCVLYELCTLNHAFAADSLLSLVFQIVNGTFEAIDPQRYSSGLSALVSALLEKDCTRRPNFAELWAMPYVHEHLLRFKDEEKMRSLKKASRRRSGLHHNHKAPADAEEMTPRQKIQARKRAQAEERAMELNVADINIHRERGIVAVRRTEQLTGSLAGASLRDSQHIAPGSLRARAQQNGAANSLGDNTAVDAHGIRAKGCAATAALNRWHTLDDTSGCTVLYGTRGSLPAAAKPSSPLDGRQDDRPLPLPGAPRAYGYGEQTLLTGPVPTQGDGGAAKYVQHAADAHDLGNSMVNLGTMQATPTGSRPGSSAPGWATPSASVQTDVGGCLSRLPQGARMQVGCLLDSSTVLMGSMQQPVQHGGAAARLGKHGWTDACVHRPQTTPSCEVEVNGFKFGMSTQTRQSLCADARTAPARDNGYGAQFGSAQQGGVFQYEAPLPAMSRQVPVPPPVACAQEASDDEEEYSDEYSDDCEDWSDEDASQDGDGYTPTARDHLRVFHDLEQIEQMAGRDHAPAEEIADDRVEAPTLRNARYLAMFDNCQRMLGREFADVYHLLKRARSAHNVDEEALTKHLFSMVSLPQQQKTNALFLLEQVVFQELLYQS